MEKMYSGCGSVKRRKILILSPSPNHSTKTSESLIIRDNIKYIKSIIRKINYELTDLTAELCKISHRNYIPVQLDHREIVSEGTLSPIISEDDFIATRILVDFSKTSEIKDYQIKSLGVSHVIAILNDSGKKGWYAGPNPVSAYVYTSYENFQYLITDIALDILQFYSFSIYNSEKYNDTFLRAKVSREKVEFTKHLRNEATFYGPIRTTNLGYISFASIARKSSKWSYKDLSEFNKYWEDFLDFDFETNEITKEISGITVDKASNFVFQNHIKCGQISKKKLDKEIDQLPQGIYFFAQIDHMPKNPQTKKYLRAIFETKHLRINKWKIFSIDDVHLVKNQKDFISLLIFSKEE